MLAGQSRDFHKLAKIISMHLKTKSIDFCNVPSANREMIAKSVRLHKFTGKCKTVIPHKVSIRN